MKRLKVVLQADHVALSVDNAGLRETLLAMLVSGKTPTCSSVDLAFEESKQLSF